MDLGRRWRCRAGGLLVAAISSLLLVTAGFGGADAGPDASGTEPMAVAPEGVASGPGTRADHASGQGPTFMGPREGCRKCHLKQYRSWEKTPHATAFETLPEDRRNDPSCVKCHVTGFGEPTGFKNLADTPTLANVTCEACHGPGSLYMDKEVMKDLHASQTRGLVIPSEETCRGCHNGESPTFPGSFDFAEMLAKGVHEIERQ